ncbi:UNVERIFIED_CONTAM: hypothetical protein GTU68_043781 [Idotea baltica]|nr:hypothetical protein [Idotea baltica]
MKRTTPRWSTNQQDNEQDPLVQQLRELQMTITHLKSDYYLEPNVFLDPFLAIIRSEDTTGPVTKSALAAVNRYV